MDSDLGVTVPRAAETSADVERLVVSGTSEEALMTRPCRRKPQILVSDPGAIPDRDGAPGPP